jgi:riboflavin biosynthesis pyrimidine reductase
MKPYLICHMVTTIDGRIMGNRWPKLPGGKSSANLFETTAASYKIGVWIVGTTTMKEFCAKPFKLKPARTKIPRRDYIANPKATRLAIGVDRRGQTHWRSNQVDGDHVVLLLTQQVSDAYLAHLQAAGVSYFFCGQRHVDLRLALDKLARAFRIKKAMVQGGGAMNGSFLKAGLLDEISHLTVPIADGGVGIQTFFDIPGPAPKKAAAKLKVISHKMLMGGVSWTKYKVV